MKIEDRIWSACLAVVIATFIFMILAQAVTVSDHARRITVLEEESDAQPPKEE